MRTALALAFMLSAEPALARCHSIWHYPWRQPGCGALVHQRTWFVEIKPEPPPAAPNAPEELTRAQAIETLKQELRMRTTQALELQTLGLTMEEKRNGD
jgi:hypothetical protein